MQDEENPFRCRHYQLCLEGGVRKCDDPLADREGYCSLRPYPDAIDWDEAEERRAVKTLKRGSEDI